MARQFTFKALLNFNFATRAELTSMCETAEAFAVANGGTFKVVTNEDAHNTSMPHYGRLTLDLPVASRAEAADLMGTIDDALSGLPDLVTVNGHQLKYAFEEIERFVHPETPPEEPV